VIAAGATKAALGITATLTVILAKSIAPQVLLRSCAVTVSVAVTCATSAKSATSIDADTRTKSPSAAPVTVMSLASSSPSSIDAASQVALPVSSHAIGALMAVRSATMEVKTAM